MDPFVFLAVLMAAACHAGWNALVKIGLDRFLSICLVAAFAGLAALFALPFVPVPRMAAWPWLLTSVGLHVGYNLFLVLAYRCGDLGQVYPIARGTAPVLVCLVMLVGFAEALAPSAMIGIVILVAGIWLMSVHGGSTRQHPDSRTVSFALITSAFIAAYTVVDGMGARLSGSAHGYAVWLFSLDGLVMAALLLGVRGRRGIGALRPHWRAGLAGGVLSLSAYWIVIWAMTMAPIALVAAIREASILFAAIISVLVLREPLTRWRSCAAVTITAGIILTRL